MSAVIGVVECPSLFQKFPGPFQRNFTPIMVAKIPETFTFTIVVKFLSARAIVTGQNKKFKSKTKKREKKEKRKNSENSRTTRREIRIYRDKHGTDLSR